MINNIVNLFHSRCDQLAAQFSQLTTKIAQQTTDAENVQCEKIAEIQKLKIANELSEQQKISVEFEYEQYRVRMKNREEELIQRLDDKTDLQLRIQTEEYVKKLREFELKHFNMEADNRELVEKLNRMAIESGEQAKLANAANTEQNKIETDNVQKKIVDLTNENGQLQSELSSYNEINGKLEAKNREWQLKVDETVNILTLMKEQYKHDRKSADDEIDQLKNEISEAQAMQSKLDTENRSLETKLSNALANCTDMDRLHDELKTLRTSNDQLTIANGELCEKLELVTVQLEEVSRKADQLSKEISDAQAMKLKLDIESQSLEVKLSDALLICSDVDRLNDELKAIRTTNDQLSIANGELSERLTTVQRDDALSKADEQVISNLKRQICDLEKTNETMSKQIAADEIRHKIKAMDNTENYNQLQSEYDELSNQVIDYIQEIDQLRQKIDELESVEKRQSENYRQLCEERTQLAEELETLKTDRKDKLSDLREPVKIDDSNDETNKRIKTEASGAGELSLVTDDDDIGINTTDTLSREIAALEAEMAKYESNQMQNSIAHENLTTGSDKQQLTAEPANEELNTLHGSVSLINVDSSQTSSEMSVLLQKIADLENASKNSAAIITSLRQEIADLETALDGVNKLCAAEQSKLASLETEKSLADETIKGEQAKMVELLTELGAIKPFKIKCEILEIGIRENTDKMSKLEIENTDVKEKMNNLTNDLFSINKKHMLEIEQLNEEHSKLQQNVSMFQLANDELREIVSKQIVELNDLKATTTDTIVDLRLQLESSEMVRQNLTDTLAGCQLNCKSDESKIVKLETELNHKTDQLLNSENVAKTLQTKCSAQLDEIARLQNDLIKADAIVELNSKVIRQTENECASMRSTFKQLENDIQTLQSENEQLRSQTSLLDRKNVELKGMVNELEDCRRELEEEVNHVRREHSKMETIEEQVSIEMCAERVTVLENELKQAVDQRMELTREIDRLTSELEFGRQSEHIIAELKGELHVCQSKLEKMCNERADLLQKIEAQRSELDKSGNSNTEIERLNDLLAHKQRSYDENHKRVLNELKKTKDLLNECKKEKDELQTALASEKSKSLAQIDRYEANEKRVNELAAEKQRSCDENHKRVLNELKKTKDLLNECRKENAELQADLAAEKSKLLAQIGRNEANERRIDELTAEMLIKSRDAAKLQTTDALVEKLTDQLCEMDRERARIVNDAKISAKQVDDLTNELNKFNGERAQIAGKTEMSAKQVEQLANELVKMRGDRKRIEDENGLFVNQIADLQMELVNIREEHAKLKCTADETKLRCR